MLGEPGVEIGELLLGEAAQREVLPVGDADLDAEVALDLRRGRGTASAVMSPRRQYAYALTVPLARPRTTLAVSHCCKRREALELAPGVAPRADEAAVGAHRVPMPAGASPCSSTTAGMPPGYVADAGRNLRSLRIRSRSSSIAHGVDEPLQRGRAACCRGCRSGPATRRIASMVGRRSSREVNSSSACAGCGLAPRPPAMNTLKPGSTVPSGRGRLHRDHADVVEHRLAAVGGAAREVDLELAGQALRDRVAQEEVLGGLGPRADVEHLVGARAGEVAARRRCGRCRRTPRGW